MKPVLACSLALLAYAASCSGVTAQEASEPSRVAAIADTVTAANADPQYRALLDAEHGALVAALPRGADGKLSQASIDGASQGAPLADIAWLKAAGYDFAREANQAAGIKILSPFTTLPRQQLERSEAVVTEVNNNAIPAQRAHAVFDADDIAFLYFIPEALGPRLGNAFLAAYGAGEVGKAAALIKATEVGTGAAKTYFNYPRPFTIDNNTIRLVPDEFVAKNGVPYTAAPGAFPSGHTNTGYTDGLLLAEMLPERFTALLDRSAGYGYSRLVLGVHYPLDVIGSRMVAQRNVAHFLNDPAYHKLFDEARDQLRAALEKRCGTTLAECAEPAGPGPDPWSAPGLRDFYRFTMTYGLPQSGPGDVAMAVPDGAEVLLATAMPGISAEDCRAILERTAIPSGYPLDPRNPQGGSWQRIDLHAAALAAH